MSKAQRVSLTLFLLSFLCVEYAQAGLVRSSGRGSLSRQFSETFYFFDNQFVNQVGIKPEVFPERFSNSITRGIGGGGNGVGATPDTCSFGYTQDQVDDDRVGDVVLADRVHCF